MSYWRQKSDSQSLKGILQCLINILLLIERIDIKVEMKKEIEKFDLDTQQYLQKPLFTIIGKFGESIRSKPLFSTLQKRMTQPGGLGSFDMPALHTWLHTDRQRQDSQLAELFKDISPLEEVIADIFNIYAQKEQIHTINSSNGFTTISPQLTSSILKVFIPSQYKELIPEVSASPRAIVVKFWNQYQLLEKPLPSDCSFSFEYSEI